MPSRISSGTLTVGILAVFVGLIGAYGVREMLLQEEAAPEGPKEFTIVVAASTIPPGRMIQATDLRTVKITSAELAKFDGLTVNEILFAQQQLIGCRTKAEVKVGEPFPADKVFLKGQGPNLADELKPGERLVTIEVGADKGAAAPIGSRVDVLFRTEQRHGTAAVAPIPEMTVTLLERVRVLASEPMGRLTGGPAPRALLTLAVPAADTDKIEVVEGHGEFSLVVRPEGDQISLASSEAPKTLDDILGIQPPEPPAAPATADIFQTVVFRRDSPSVNSFIGGRPARDLIQRTKVAIGGAQAAPAPADDDDADCKTCGGKKDKNPVPASAAPKGPVADPEMNGQGDSPASGGVPSLK